MIEAPYTLIRFHWNKNGAVLLRFQKHLRPHLLFSYRFRPSTLQRRIRFENAFIPSVRRLKWTWRMRILIYRPAKMARNWSHMVASVRPPFWILTVSSPFSDSIIFSVHTRKQRFRKASFSIRSTLESVFEWLRFGVVVWTIAVSGSKQLRFGMTTD